MKATCENCGRPVIERPIPDPQRPWLVKRWAWRHQITKIDGQRPRCRRAVPVYDVPPLVAACVKDAARRLSDPELRRLSKEGTTSEFVDAMFKAILG